MPMRRNISARTRSATPLTISAPSCEGSTWVRNGRQPRGLSAVLQDGGRCAIEVPYFTAAIWCVPGTNLIARADRASG
jgi:hypothetical protein